MLAVLKRLVKRLRQAWPDTLLIFRGDSHFAYPEVMQWIEGQSDLSYVTWLTSKAVLQALAREVVEQTKRAYERPGRKITRFHSTRYQAGTWSRSRRVVIKVEVSDQGINTRFVVTDLEQSRTKVLKTSPWACATMETIQLRLLKLGARVQEFTDRITISLPSSCPVAPVLRRSLTLLACVRLISQAL